jgi:aldose 1-epimerase
MTRKDLRISTIRCIIPPMATKLPIGLVSLALALCMGQAAPPASAPLKRVEETTYGTMADGSVIKLYTFANAKGMQARVMTLGAQIVGIKVPDKAGVATNVVFCGEAWAQAQRFGMAAQTVGPVVNRIAGAKFTLEGKDYTLQANNGGNTLHSGGANFGGKVWQGKALPPTDHAGSAQLTYTSKDGDGGFPGAMTATVTFTVNDDNEFRIEYQATSDKTTIVNLTNHAYFNLNGAAGWGNSTASPIATEELWIDADQVLVCGAGLIPTGAFAPVAGTALDFTKPIALGARAAQQASYDHAYVLKNGGKLALVGRLRDPKSGREMEVRTDQPGIQVYTGQPTAVALETQHHPDSIHHDNFPTTILKPGETFKTTTVYAFSAK